MRSLPVPTCDNPAMIHIDIRPVWRFRSGDEREFDFRLVPLLEGLEATGKLTRAAEHAGISYRHAWNLIEQWTGFFAAPLVVMEKGRGSQLTALGSNLLWAGKRAQARLEPELANLASEFARALNDSLHESGQRLYLQASHDFAVAGLCGRGTDAGVTLDIQYKGSFEALAALRRRECDLAGFHIPEGPLGALMARRYAECLPAGEHVLIGFVTRTQGFIVRPGNPKAIRTVADLCRPDVSMVNRQRGSGTRALFEFLVSAAAIDRSRIRGYESEESTHSAVATLIAGNQADVGLGVAEAAAQYRLDFVPLCNERYYFACRRDSLETPKVGAFLSLLRSADIRALAETLAGYEPDRIGAVIDACEVLQETATPSQG